MKQRPIQRSVRSVRVERAAGDAPDIGRVGRMPGVGASKGLRRRKRKGESSRGNRLRNNRRKVMITWSVVFMLLVVVMVGWAVWLKVRPAPANSTDEGQSAPVVQERVASRFPSPTEEDALSMVRRALNIRESAKVTEYFRTGASRPEDVLAFLRDLEKNEGKVTGTNWLSSMDANGLLIDGVLVDFSVNGETRNRLALMTPDEKGRWRIDFEAFARVCRPPLNEIIETSGSLGLVRVVVAKDMYYNGPFKDESQWVCYGLASPDNEKVFLGYCRKGSPQEAALAKILEDEGQFAGTPALNRATLEIRHVEGAEKRQFEITRVLAEDWVLGAKPFDEDFK